MILQEHLLITVMGKCNWCGREAKSGIYYGKGLFPTFYCSNRCLNRAISSGIERPGMKSHSASPLERFMNIVIFASFALPVLYAILDGIAGWIISTIQNFFN